MPLPLFFMGAAAVSAAVGAGKTIKAGVDNSIAKHVNSDANDRITEARTRLENARTNAGNLINNLGKEKIYILNNSIDRFLDSFEKIKNVEFDIPEGINELNKIRIDCNSFVELREMSDIASSFVSGSVAGVASGAIIAFGAYNAATTFATASTGTAIATLSGAAASNATLAFFGGGSLATGGIAGGTAVLGGLVAGPALLVMGVMTGSKASKNLDDAYSNEAKSNKVAAELDMATDLCKNISRRTLMFYNLLARLDAYFVPLVYKLEEIVEREGTDYSKYSLSSKNTLAGVATVAKTIKSVLNTPILNEDGSLTDESEKLATKIYNEPGTNN